MKTVKNRFSICLFCILFICLVDSAPFPNVVVAVGNVAVLPCSLKSGLGLGELSSSLPGSLPGSLPTSCHIQWTNPPQTVFERNRDSQWQNDEFKGRVEVPEPSLASGDCSLIINDVQIKDSGRYESFMVVDGDRSKKTRVFIQSVKLSVIDHKSLQSRGPGEDVVLDLHTAQSVRVVFQDRNNSDWSDVWMRGDKDSGRIQKHPIKEQLTVKKLKMADSGTYKVLDANGLAVSTVQLTVEAKNVPFKSQQVTEYQVPTADATRSSSSYLLICLSVLLSIVFISLS